MIDLATNLLASSSQDDPQFMGELIFAVLGLLGGGAAVAGILWRFKQISGEASGKMKISPSPLPIEVMRQFATQEELKEAKQELRAEIRDRHDAQDAQLKRQNEKLENVERRLHERIDPLSEKLAGIDTKVDGLAKDSQETRQDIKTILKRLPAQRNV